MKYVKVDHNNPKQKEIDKNQLDFCKNKCTENCSECNIHLYSNIWT